MVKKKRKKPGPVTRKFTDAEYKTLEDFGAFVTQVHLAHVLGITLRTFERMLERDKKARQIMNEKMATANANVSKSLYNKAIEGNTTAQIWWDKTRGGHKETRVNEISDPTGALSRVKHKDMTPAEYEAEMERIYGMGKEELPSFDAKPVEPDDAD